MITPETALQIQAHLDGECTHADATRITRLLEQDPEAKVLLDELSQTRNALLDQELPRTVPESREFYWSKIARAIQQQTPAPALPCSATASWWFRFAASLGGVAALAIVTVVSLKLASPSLAPAASALEIIDDSLMEVSSITFRSDAEGITVVWVNND